MNPPIFRVIDSSPEVRALLRAPGGATRFYAFGIATETTPKPYAVWQIVGGEPENYLAQRPDVDDTTNQIDVYAATAASARQVAEALCDAIEPEAYITTWLGERYDEVTKLYRFTFMVDWITPR